ncbi:MAG TPA: ABC transporter permease subunit [Candidatus Limnocylindrales bacterium]|nr:ABC transporter permease subunit [Candidatus Limnocylindrales bacterium]
MNLRLLRRTVAAQRTKLLLVMVSLAFWGALMPIIYKTIGLDANIKRLFESGALPRQFTQFGGGDLFSLPGAIALGFIHPLAVALVAVFAVGFAASAVAGERQRGTLEVLLARPVPRRAVYLTLLVATLGFIGLSLAALIAGAIAGSAFVGLVGEVDLENVPALWLNGLLLFGALGSIGLAASVASDRLSHALGPTLAVTIVSYFLDVLGTLWPDAEGLRSWSVFYYLKPKETLIQGAQGFDLGLLAAIGLAAAVVALMVFPRRDIAAPS